MARTRVIVGSTLRRMSRPQRYNNVRRAFGDITRYSPTSSRTPDGNINPRGGEYGDVDNEFYDHLHRYFGGDQKKINAWLDNPNPRTSADNIIKGSERIKSGQRKKAYASITG